MSNFGIKLDLAKLQGMAVADLQTPQGIKQCVVIPVAENNLFVGQKGVYLDLVAFEMKNPKFDATHSIRQSLPKAVREAMTDEQRNSQPILGDLKPLGGGSSQTATQRQTLRSAYATPGTSGFGIPAPPAYVASGVTPPPPGTKGDLPF